MTEFPLARLGAKLIVMWTTFLPDLLIAMIGAVLGSVLTVFIAAATFFIQRRRNDIGAVRALIDDIHHRRALAVGDPETIPNAAVLPDFEHANLSVLDLRDRVRESRSRIRPQSQLQAELSKMIRACNRYLERTSFDPTRYLFDLEQLNAELRECIYALATNERAIGSYEPGGAAF